VHARVDERQVREDLGEVPKVEAGVRFYLLGVQQQRAGAGRQLLAWRPGARLASPISVSAKTTHNERIVNVPSSPGPRTITAAAPVPGETSPGPRSHQRHRLACSLAWPKSGHMRRGSGARRPGTRSRNHTIPAPAITDRSP